jgi:segregation and condensation protein B
MPESEQDAIATLLPLLESLLCATGEPLTLDRAVDAIGGVAHGDVSKALRALADQYEKDGRGFRLAEIAGGFQLRTAPENIECVRRLFRERPMRLTRAMLETLAIVAYRQPVTRPEIEAIRGVDVDSAVSTLLERKLIRIAGRKEAPGRPLLYATSKEFLEVFGLRELTDLPTLKEIGDIPIVSAPEIDLRSSQVAEATTISDERTAGTLLGDAVASERLTVLPDADAGVVEASAEQPCPPNSIGRQD